MVEGEGGRMETKKRWDMRRDRETKLEKLRGWWKKRREREGRKKMGGLVTTMATSSRNTKSKSELTQR